MEDRTSQSLPESQKQKGYSEIPFIFRNRFLLLLIFLCIVTLIGPLLKNCLGDYLGEYTENFIFVVVLLAGLRSISRNHTLFLATLVTAVICIALSVCNVFLRSANMGIVIFGVDVVFVALICAGILWHILQQKRVDVDTIIGGVCIYLLLGMLWAFIYAIIELLAPGSFTYSFGEGGFLHSSEIFSPLWYFSYATLTTMGLGDIVPVSETARGMAIAEGITGQIYLIVFIARLLGLHLAGRHFELQMSKK